MENEGGVTVRDIGQLNSVDMQVAKVLMNVLLVAQSNRDAVCKQHCKKELSQKVN